MSAPCVAPSWPRLACDEDCEHFWVRADLSRDDALAEVRSWGLDESTTIEHHDVRRCTWVLDGGEDGDWCLLDVHDDEEQEVVIYDHYVLADICMAWSPAEDQECRLPIDHDGAHSWDRALRAEGAGR